MKNCFHELIDIFGEDATAKYSKGCRQEGIRFHDAFKSG